MKRMSIFEILASDIDINEEIDRLETLSREILFIDHGINTGLIYKLNLFQFCDKYCFFQWKQRNRCLTCKEYLNKMNSYINGKVQDPIEKAIYYLEFVSNVLLLCEKHYKKHIASFSTTDKYTMLNANVESLIDHLNHEKKYYESEQRVILIQKNAAATSVAEIVDQNLALQVIEYNHHSMKGDLVRKKKALLALGDKLEPMRKDIPSPLAEDVFFMLNNLNIRHNNIDKGSKQYKEITANMSPATLEAWYDELYQAALLAILSVDHKDRTARIADLKIYYK